MKNLNYEEVQDALKLIQKVCSDIDNCAMCPFSNNDGDCFITMTPPHNWQFTDPTPVIRLMK